MGLENSFSSIRKAIVGTAEKSAEKELLEKSEARHYEAAFDYFKTVRALSPEKIETLITIAAKSKELKDEMGKELYNNSNQILKNIMKGVEEQFNQAVDNIKKTTGSEEEFRNELANFNQRFIKIKMEEFKINPLVLSSFEGKENLLTKFINSIENSTINILDAYEKSEPMLKEISPKEFFEILARRQRGNLTGVELREKIKQEKLTKGLFNRIMQFFRSVK